MTLKEFKTLTKQKQYRVILHTGVYLASRSLPGMKAELFQVDGFYLEAFYRLPAGEVTFMKIFEGTNLLDPYLQAIDLEGLLPCKGS